MTEETEEKISEEQAAKTKRNKKRSNLDKLERKVKSDRKVVETTKRKVRKTATLERRNVKRRAKGLPDASKF